MHDIVIRGGTILDAPARPPLARTLPLQKTGSPGRREAGPARANRCHGADGYACWVDVHTALRRQAMWIRCLRLMLAWGDDRPFRKLRRGFRAGEKASSPGPDGFDGGVEEIPNPVLAAGLTWEWRAFLIFMDALERRERVIDIAAQARAFADAIYVMAIAPSAGKGDGGRHCADA